MRGGVEMSNKINAETQNTNPKTISYELYSAVAKDYDCTRSPVGISYLCEKIRALSKKQEKLSILDLGCGTGNYLYALKRQFPDLLVTGLDVNQDMLAVAKKKMSHFNGDVQFIHSSIFDLHDTVSNKFDIVLINQVLHHLSDPKAVDHFYLIKKTLGEVYHVLNPNGKVLINTCSPEQIKQGFWYAPLMPKTINNGLKYICPIEKMCLFLKEHQFNNIVTDSNTELLQTNPIKFNSLSPPEGPLTQEFFNGDSFFRLADDSERLNLQIKMQSLIQNNAISQFFEKANAVREKVGQSTFICAEK